MAVKLDQSLSKLASSATSTNGARRNTDGAVVALHSLEAHARTRQPPQPQHPNHQHISVLRKHLPSRQSNARGSTGSLDVPAALSASAHAGSNMEKAKHEKRYEEMMKRFQIRRLQLPDAAKEGPFISQRRGSAFGVLSAGRRGSARGLSLDARAKQYLLKDGRQLTRSGSKNERQRGSLIDTRATVIDMSNAAAASAYSATPSLVAGEAESGATMRAKLEKIYADGASWRWVLIAWKRKLASKWRQVLRRLKQPISPFSTFFRVRMAVLGAGLFTYVVSFPLKLAFIEGEEEWNRWVDYTLELVSFAEFILMFNTSFLDTQNKLVTSRRAIAVHYLTGWGVCDLFSSIPIHFTLDYVAGVRVAWYNPSVVFIDVIARILRIVHFHVVVQIIWEARSNRTRKNMFDWLLYSRYSHLLRIAFIICCILVIAHYMACIWKTLSPESSAIHTRSLYEVYAASFFDALQLLQGQGVPTSSLNQNAFASFAVLIGSIVLAIIFGHVAVLVSNFNANSTNYQRKMESVFAIMTKMQLPAPLRERIHQYYEHLWREYESLDGEIGRFSKDLSHTLELEVVLFKYMELVMGVPFWKNCSPDFQKQLALSLQIRVYLPDDFIIRRGEIGDEFYMINHGSGELETGGDSFERVTRPLRKKNASGLSDFANFLGSKFHPTSSVNEDESEESECSSSCSDDEYQEKGLRKSKAKRSIYRTENYDEGENSPDSAQPSKATKKLSRGQAFGEMALLMNYRRTVNVRAITYMEMCVLNRSDFHQILARHPDDRKLVVLCMLTNFIEGNEVNKVQCPLMEIVREVYGADDPVKTASITPAFAVEIIARVLIPELEDASIQYGITSKLTQQLEEYRDRVLKNGTVRSVPHTTCTSDVNLRRENTTGLTQRAGIQKNETNEQASPELLARIESIENTQEQIMQCISEMREFILEIQSTHTADSVTKES